MKTTILLALMITSLVIVGCTKTAETADTQDKASDTSSASTVTEFVEQPTIDPDIGTLDNIPVSEELPQ